MDNEKDKFIEIIRDKLTNHTVPVDDDSWDKIAERLNPASKKIQRIWLAAIAIAAGFLLLFLLFPDNKKTSHTETATRLSDHEKAIIKEIPGNETDQPVLSRNIESPKTSGKTNTSGQMTENVLTTEEVTKEEPTKENPAVPEVKKEEPKVAENHTVSPKSDFIFEENEQTPVIKHKKSKSIRFSVGSGANLLAENTANTAQIPMSNPGVYSNLGAQSYFRAAALNVAESRTEEILSYSNYPNVSYRLPLSFGVTVKKELNRTFAIESGIVYSFLSTSFYREAFPKANADLQLHYLGIPLNLHTRLFGDRLSQWEMYLSTGGMVEKGILSHFVQKTYYDNIDNVMETIVSNEKINGLQWSVNISPGVDYRLYKNYSIYLEPKVSYYFDNNQPISARTNHPLAVGINAGIRYTWK